MNSQFAITLTFIILILDGIMIGATYISRLITLRRKQNMAKIEEDIIDQFSNEEIDFTLYKPKNILLVYANLCDNLQLPEAQRQVLMQYLFETPLCAKYIKNLSSRFYIKRAEAAHHLKYLEIKEIQEALLLALKKERHPVVILQLAHTLATQRVIKAIRLIVMKLNSQNPWFARRLRSVLYTYKEDFFKYIKNHTDSKRYSTQLLLCEFAAEYPAEEFRICVKELALNDRKQRVQSLALITLLRYFPEELMKEPFISTTSRRILSYVIQAYSTELEPEHVEAIMTYANCTSLHERIIQSLSEMSSKDPKILSEILSRFEQSSSDQERSIYAKVLANRVEYYLTRINSPLELKVVNLIEELVKANRTSAILFFLNRNQDPEIENKIFKILRKLSTRSKNLKADMKTYLEPEILKRHSFLGMVKVKKAQLPHNEPPQRLYLILLFVAIMVSFPLFILVKEFPSMVSMQWKEIGKLYVVRFNYLLVFYSSAINLGYLVILGLSFRGSRIQARLWKLKDKHFLYTRRLLPSISIIAPAYNESTNIIESTNSLLNQRYPHFELIVVNDGSKDQTLNTLIDYYKLEKRDMIFRTRLKTRPLRGIYVNKNIPNLIVVDKMNGGKADSLNMGLNISSKEFFCGIDADCLLEPEALLRAVAVMIDSREESIAAGGNICAVNGCTVERGALEEIALPKKFIARLQSLEYLRAFMSGRVGWAYINTLLIISGAFGIFNCERTIKTGGYLTKSGKYHKDTVGEDMELVVRLSRQMHEQKVPYTVNYAFNANCWTEVPETWKILHRQRDRWHRGLIDIMLYHRKLIGNLRYGRLGMIGMLYYFIFETIGPFIEIQGLLMVFIAAIVGLLNASIALLLFTTTILLGILVSISSVFISEFDVEMYSTKDIIRLLRMAIIENFGIRQLVSLWRVTGYFSAMRKSRGWGVQVRKGFSTKPAPPSVKINHPKK